MERLAGVRGRERLWEETGRGERKGECVQHTFCYSRC